MPSTRRSSRSPRRTTRPRCPRPARRAGARSRRRAAARWRRRRRACRRGRRSGPRSRRVPADRDGVDLVGHVAREDVLEVGADRLAALEPQRAGSGWSARRRSRSSRRRRTAPSGRRRRGRRRRAAARRRPGGVGVDGGHGRTVAARPSSPRQAERQSRYRLAAHAARAAPRRVAGRGRRRAVAMPPRAAARGRCWPGSRCTRASTRAASVAARFWPDVLDSSARASLRSALWELRRALGDDDALSPAATAIALRCETDLAEFDALRARRAGWRPRSRCTAGRCWPTSTTTGCWRRATSTPSGSARRSRGSPRRPTGPADAVGWARRRLALDPLDEDAARDLMRRLADAGDRPARSPPTTGSPTACASALGLAPSAQTRALAAAIREEGGARRNRTGGPPSAAPTAAAAARGR